MADLEQVTDGELMGRAALGDRQAFATVVDRYKHQLLTYLTRLCGDRQRAEDLAQDAFVTLYQTAARYEERGKLAAYLYRIATNRLRSEERRRRTFDLLRPLLLAGRARRSEPQPMARLAVREAAEQLRRELVRLPLRYRAPLLLFAVEEWSYGEIAALMGCAEGTVKSRIHRGKARLRVALAPYWEPATGGPALLAEPGGEA